jgi:predicted transcriptional regulator
MAAPKFSKFIRPEAGCPGRITDRDLDILDAILRYRFCSAAQIVRLAGGNEDVIQSRLRRLWECGLVNRWAFPGFRTHSEFYYYLDTREPLDHLAERRVLEIHPQMHEEIRSHREKDYADAALRGQHMQLGFPNHGLMISRMHFMVEMACRGSNGAVALKRGSRLGRSPPQSRSARVKCSKQGGDLSWEEADEKERLPVELHAMFTLRFTKRSPESQLAHFFYEADRGSMVMTDMLKKFRGYYHFIKKQQRHKEAFGIHPIRAVLVETTDEARGKRLMELATHPLVCGTSKRSGLFWFTISLLFTDSADGSPFPRHLVEPKLVLGPVWALPDRAMRRLGDAENSPISASPAT